MLRNSQILIAHHGYQGAQQKNRDGTQCASVPSLQGCHEKEYKFMIIGSFYAWTVLDEDAGLAATFIGGLRVMRTKTVPTIARYAA